MKTAEQVFAHSMTLLTPEQRTRVLAARKARAQDAGRALNGVVLEPRSIAAPKDDRAAGLAGIVDALGRAVDDCDHLHIRVDENDRGTSISIYAGRRRV